MFLLMIGKTDTVYVRVFLNFDLNEMRRNLRPNLHNIKYIGSYGPWQYYTLDRPAP